jgi:WD40 repeat protein
VNSVAFLADGRRVLTASDDHTAQLWDAASGAKLEELPGHPADVNCALFSPDGSIIATASTDGVRLWDAATAKLITQLSGQAGPVNSVAFSPDGQYLAGAADDRTARLWNVSSGQLVRTFAGHQGRVYSVAFDPGGHLLVTASEDRTVRLWDVGTGALIETFEGHNDIVNDAVFSRDGRRILTASNDKTARVWEITNVPTLSADQIWDWLRLDSLRPMSWDERNAASLTNGDPSASLPVAADEAAWLDPARASDLKALENAAAGGSWSANLRLGEMAEQSPTPKPIDALRFYAVAADVLDAEMNRSEKNDLALDGYAVEAFARRGSLTRYLVRHGDIADVLKVSLEVKVHQGTQ